MRTMLRRVGYVGCLVLVWCASCLAAEEAAPLRILFVGSSSTYMHNLPDQVARLLETQASGGVQAHLAGRSGTGVHVYLRPDFRPQYGLAPGETILTHIEREKYGLVVLQMVAEFIAGEEGAEFDRAVDAYCTAIRRAGGEPAFYEMGWGRDETNDRGQERILQAALRNRVTRFAPCSTAWERVRQLQPDLELFNLPDTVHPGTVGHYLNLCCFYAALTGKSPAELPPTVVVWPRFGSFDKAEADRRLEALPLNAYESRLPDFMKRMTAMRATVRLDDDVAKLLQRSAWETWQDIRKRLAAQ